MGLAPKVPVHWDLMMNNAEIFTILYEVGGQQFLIGVTKDHPPVIAAQGVNTTRPLPQNIKEAIINTVMDIRKMEDVPEFIDYNAPSTKMSYSLLGNLTVNPIAQYGKPQKTVNEVVKELKEKMVKKGKK